MTGVADRLDDLLDDIDEVLSDEDDPFPWTDSMTWYPDPLHAPDGRVYLDQAGWVL